MEVRFDFFLNYVGWKITFYKLKNKMYPKIWQTNLDAHKNVLDYKFSDISYAFRFFFMFL